MAPINDDWTCNYGSVEVLMVSEGMSSASTTTPHALLLCSLVGCNQGSTFVVTKSIPLLARFLFFLGCFFQLSLVPNTIALFRVLPVFDLPGALLDQRDRGHAQIVQLYGHVGARFLYVERSRWEDVKWARLARDLSLSRARVRSCCEADMAARLRRACSAWRSRRFL
ncbi:hypothetical protein PC114_g18888 [Phytophthora cactorum]|nr:hypothetical protein PC114_g18888 [Phytophthora cactorum]